MEFVWQLDLCRVRTLHYLLLFWRLCHSAETNQHVEYFPQLTPAFPNGVLEPSLATFFKWDYVWKPNH